jgi:hypothetical protein
MTYLPSPTRYQHMHYRRCGRSGLLLPAVSLGLWHNFGHVDVAGKLPRHPPPRFRCRYHALRSGQQLRPAARLGRGEFRAFPARRTSATTATSLIISTKAGYRMWDGPYGEWGSKKYLVASLDQSLQRMGLDYVDIFTATVPTRIRRWKKPWPHSTLSCGRARHCTWAFPIIPPNKLPRRAASCGARHTLPDPPAQVLHVRCAGSKRPARCAGAGRRAVFRFPRWRRDC